MRVLVVDPSENIRRRLCELLSERCLLQVIDAGETSRALQLASSPNVGVVLLEIGLTEPNGGERSGLALLAQFKRLAPSALIVVLTNHANDAYRQACILNGADYFFDKSLEFERAVDVTRRLAGSRNESKLTT